MPMDARLLGGTAGFSTKSVTRSVSSVARMPKRLASSMGTGITAMVASAPLASWKRVIRL